MFASGRMASRQYAAAGLPLCSLSREHWTLAGNPGAGVQCGVLPRVASGGAGQLKAH